MPRFFNDCYSLGYAFGALLARPLVFVIRSIGPTTKTV
jgi:hypothetical protein